MFRSLFLFVLFFAVIISSPLRAAQVTLRWDPSPDPDVVQYRVYGGIGINSLNAILSITGREPIAVVSNLVAGALYTFAVTAVNASGAESDFSNTIFHLVPHSPPSESSKTVTTLQNLPVSIFLSGADSNNNLLTFQIQTSPANGTLSGIPPELVYRPNSNFFGIDRFTYVASDGTSNSVLATMTINVLPRNEAPTIDPIPNVSLIANSEAKTIYLSGIRPGASGDAQTLIVSAFSSNPGLVTPIVRYTSPDETGALVLKPGGLTGTAMITVTVNVGGTVNNIVLQRFFVSVKMPLPVVSSLFERSNDARTLTLSWETDQPALCTVEYGPTIGMGLVSPRSFGISHTLTLTNLEPATIYYLRVRAMNLAGGLTVSTDFTAATEPVRTVLFAAESGQLTSPMAAYMDPAAQSSQYITADSTSGKAVFNLNLEDGLSYRLWSRVKTGLGGGTFYVSADGGPESLVTIPPGTATDWQWVLLSSANWTGSSALILPLGAGAHRITVRTDANTLIDEFALCNDPQWQPSLVTIPPLLSLSASSPLLIELKWTIPAGNPERVAIEWSLDGTNFSTLGYVPSSWSSLLLQNPMTASFLYFRIYAFNSVERTGYSNIAVRQPWL
jgi:hypothetical protein